MSTPDERVLALPVKLPPPPTPMAMFRTVNIVGNMAHVSGHVPFVYDADGKQSMITGKAGATCDGASNKHAFEGESLWLLG
jgi:hypothetical protein